MIKIKESEIVDFLVPDIKNELWMRSKSPTKLFEYMAMGKTVVASNIGEANNVIKDGHSGFFADSIGAFAEKMELLAKDLKLRLEMGKNARQAIEENYSFNILGKRLFEIIASSYG